MEKENLNVDFIKALGELKNPTKNAINPHFKNRYATLDVICDEIREVFKKFGIAIVQIPQEIADGKLVLSTKLYGCDGVIDFGNYPIKAVKDDPQGIGSAITYARRYSLCAICGIAAEDDDDANFTSGKEEKKAPAKPLMSQNNPQVKAEIMGKVAGFVAKEMKLDKVNFEIMKTFWVEKFDCDLTKCSEQSILTVLGAK